jgi:L-iditol 2-dehydrogenase
MLAASVHAVRKAGATPGDFCVVFGPGPVGLSMAQLLKAEGAQVAVVGTRDYRLTLAKELGADHVFNIADASSPYATQSLAESVQAANGGRLADRVIVGTGSMSASQDALAVSGPGSTVVYMGVTGPEDNLQLPMLTSLIADRTIRFSLWHPFEWPTTIRLLEQSVVETDRIITHDAPLGGIGDAIERVVGREDDVIKTVIKPG